MLLHVMVHVSWFCQFTSSFSIHHILPPCISEMEDLSEIGLSGTYRIIAMRQQLALFIMSNPRDDTLQEVIGDTRNQTIPGTEAAGSCRTQLKDFMQRIGIAKMKHDAGEDALTTWHLDMAPLHSD